MSQVATGRQPLRRCIMCRRSSPKAELLRFVATNEGIAWDAAHRLPGRGAYVHRGMSCWGKVLERARWEHAFRRRVSVTQEGLRVLQQQTRAEVPELLIEKAVDEGADAQRKDLGQKVRL